MEEIINEIIKKSMSLSANTEEDIIIISAVFPPEPQVSARMSWDLANYLVAQGFAVTVLCPQPSRPLNANYSKYYDKVSVVSYENNIKVVRLSSFTSPESRMLPRMWESISFGVEVVKYISVQNPKPALLYVNSWPLFSQIMIAGLARKNAVPIVLQVMDIYPETLTNKLPVYIRPVVYTPLKWLDNWIARSATTVAVISENTRYSYSKTRGINIDNVVTIPTWQDEAAFINIPPRSECCRKYGISQDPFTFLFLGNIGPIAGVDFLIRAFTEAGINNSQLLIVGDGSAKSECVKLVNELNLKTVHFVSDPDVTNVPVLQGMANVCVLPMKKGASMSSIPSKFPSYLFSSKPVIATVDHASDTAACIRQAECGWVGDAENLVWLAKTMRDVSEMSLDQLETIGQRGKKFGLTQFSKSSGVVKLAETVMQAASVSV
ncbi:MAG: glycosyltransferase family 4 protein [Deltaproteobacteria bacterium]|jgi:glycosyltransferase involved in cell wall biosynthesis|nr:glycosyltransferase family 4 protein [Deltaproteobacteria bacterium]